MEKRQTEQVYKQGTQSADDPYTFIMSSETTDRMGDVIRQKGWELEDFKANPIALFGHMKSFPIGHWQNVRVVGKKLMGELVLAKQGTSDRIDEIRSLVEQRVLRAVSVGFRVLEYEPMQKDDPWGPWDIKRQTLHETSLVSVPANQEALMVARQLGVSDETKQLIFGRLSADRNRRAVSGEKRQPDYSDIIGESSDLVRVQKRLRDAGMI